MTAGPVDRFEVPTIDDVLVCFDATCAEVFRQCCRLAAGNLELASALLIDTYLSVAVTPEPMAEIAAVGPKRLVTNACRIAVVADRSIGVRDVGVVADGASGLTLTERAVGELHDRDRHSLAETAELLGLDPPAVAAALARALDVTTIPENIASTGVDVLRRYERWLDDRTRNRCRAAIRERARSTAPVSSGSARSAPATAGPDHPSPPTGGRSWGTQAAADAGAHLAQRPRRRPQAIGLALGLVALVAIGIAALDDDSAVQPSSSAQSSVSDRSTIAPSEAGALSPTTLFPGYIVAEAPVGFRATGAYGHLALAAGGRFGLWAEPGATRPDGEWIAIAVIGTTVSGRFTLAGGSPIEIDGLPAEEAVSADGVKQIAMQLPSGGRFSIAAHGFGDDRLRAIATTIVREGGGFRPDNATDLVGRGLELLASAPNPFGNVGSQVQAGDTSSSSYQSIDLSRRLSLSSRPTTPNDLLVAQFLLPASSDDLAPEAPDRSFQLGERTLTIGAETAFDGKTNHTIQWHEGDDTITLSGTADLAVLLAAVPSVRRATAGEWLTLSLLPPFYYPV